MDTVTVVMRRHTEVFLKTYILNITNNNTSKLWKYKIFTAMLQNSKF